MRQASWIAFLLLTLGIITYEASLDPTAQPKEEIVTLEEGGIGPPPKP
jgi:hypothetical protein